MQPKNAAIRKRTQISQASRTMFLWVAAVSVIFGFALVGSIFLIQKLQFNQRVLNVKAKTVQTLQANNAVVSKLEDQVRVLDTNTALNSIKANTTDQAVQVILDALPSSANSLALGASLQTKLLANIPNLSLSSISVNPVAGVETSADDPSATVATDDLTTTQNAISFTFTIDGTQDALKTALTNLERSIRAINITKLQITSDSATTQTMTVSGEAYYEPAVVAKLKDISVK